MHHIQPPASRAEPIDSQPSLFNMNQKELLRQIGLIDINLLDQIMKGRFDPSMRVLDAGCGNGRNLVWFLRGGFQVHGIDQDEESVAATAKLAAKLAPHLPDSNFRQESIEALPFRNETFDLVICIAVLHFAKDEEHFYHMFNELMRVLKPGGIMFIRLATSIGLEERIRKVEGLRYRLPDGTERFLVDEKTIYNFTKEYGSTMVEPIKTVNVQNERCMTTWVLKKGKSELAPTPTPEGEEV